MARSALGGNGPRPLAAFNLRGVGKLDREGSLSKEEENLMLGEVQAVLAIVASILAIYLAVREIRRKK